MRRIPLLPASPSRICLTSSKPRCRSRTGRTRPSRCTPQPVCARSRRRRPPQCSMWCGTIWRCRASSSSRTGRASSAASRRASTAGWQSTTCWAHSTTRHLRGATLRLRPAQAWSRWAAAACRSHSRLPTRRPRRRSSSTRSPWQATNTTCTRTASSSTACRPLRSCIRSLRSHRGARQPVLPSRLPPLERGRL